MSIPTHFLAFVVLISQRSYALALIVSDTTAFIRTDNQAVMARSTNMARSTHVVMLIKNVTN